ncbi:MAG: hypothetical protein COB98_04960 [Flavobacteriaceae bacterium]|nr:MAG: hypothetical protein COB98_04960 [Flavobacteriaceae bacterium]
MFKRLFSDVRFFLTAKKMIWVLPLFSIFIVAFLMPVIFNKYTLELVHEENREQTKLLTFFEDLDNDGMKEKFDISNYRNKFASCLYKKNESSLIQQFNFYGNIPTQENLNTPIFNDINKDGVKELFLFTQKNDSIFINGVDFVSSKVILSGRFITTIGKGTKARDFVLRPIINHDSDADGVDEMYFLINGGFALYPRKIMAYNFVKDTFLSSINTGSQHYVTPVIKDGQLLLYSTTLASGNCPENFEYPYADHRAILFVFDDQLKILREPLEFEGVGACIDGPIVYNNEYHFYTKSTIGGEEKSVVFKMTSSGEMIKELPFKTLSMIEVSFAITVEGERRYLVNCMENNVFKTYEYSPQKMKLFQNNLTSKVGNSTLVELNIEVDEPVFFAVNHQYNKRTSLWLENLNYQLDFEIPLYVRPWNVYFQTTKNELGTVIKVTDRRKLQTYLLHVSKYYPLRFVLFIVVYFLVVLLLLSLRHYKKYRALQKNQLQQQISSLHLRLVNSQLDPHFTFNVLNTVSAKILKGDRMEAYDLMSDFSNMLRTGLFFSEANDWSIQQEFKFTVAFLNLMKSRFSRTFDFKMIVPENIKLASIMIPRLLVQNFAQNSIKHAFMGLKKNGLLTISVIEDKENYLVSIKDNGIGRVKSEEFVRNMKGNCGKGIELNRKQIALYNSLYKTTISFEINDVVLNGLVCGTEVIISIPNIKE